MSEARQINAASSSLSVLHLWQKPGCMCSSQRCSVTADSLILWLMSVKAAGGSEDEHSCLPSPEEAINFHAAIKETVGNRFPYKWRCVSGNEALLAHHLRRTWKMLYKRWVMPSENKHLRRRIKLFFPLYRANLLWAYPYAVLGRSSGFCFVPQEKQNNNSRGLKGLVFFPWMILNK